MKQERMEIKARKQPWGGVGVVWMERDITPAIQAELDRGDASRLMARPARKPPKLVAEKPKRRRVKR